MSFQTPGPNRHTYKYFIFNTRATGRPKRRSNVWKPHNKYTKGGHHIKITNTVNMPL